jgi:integrase
MRGHVRQRGKTWAIVYDEGYDENGKRRQRWRGGFATKREAQSALNDVLPKLEHGDYVAPSKVTLGEFLEGEWLPSRESKVRPTSFITYRSLLRNHVIPHLGTRRLQELSPGHVNELYAKLEKAGLAAETRRLIHGVLSKALGDAVRWDRITRNPIQRVDKPKPSKRRTTAWTAKELGRFLAVVADDRLVALWRLAATTGMRRGELLGLTWRSLDLNGGRLTVERQLLLTGSFGPPKSDRSQRTIRLDAETIAALERHRDAQRVERALAGDAYEDGDLVFADELGRPIPPPWLSARFLSHRKAAGISVGTLHILRHTAATLMLTNGIPVHITAARLGDRPETILKTYTHLLPQSDEQAALGMAELLAEAR